MFRKIYIQETYPTYSQFCRLWRQTDWPLVDETIFLKIHSSESRAIVFCAFSKNRLVGYSRLLTDYAMYAYLQDLVVDQRFRNRGIGSEMLMKTYEKSKCLGLRFFGLFSVHESVGFYEKQDLKQNNSNFGMGYDLC